MNQPNRPNILMIFSDQHRAEYAGFMGHETVETPHLDKLAARGVTFDTAYCNSPLCSPSRQSFMAGQHVHRIGVWDNTAAMPETTVTWAHALSAAGYETSLLGKMHFNGYQKMYGFDRRPVLEGTNEERGLKFYSWGVRPSVNWSEPLPYRWHVLKEVREAGPDTPEREPIFASDLDILAGTLQELEEKGRDTSGTPWAICAGFVLPHPPFKGKAELIEKYKERTAPAVNPGGQGVDTCDRWLQRYYGNPAELSAEEVANARAVYYALITEFDEYVGQILQKLEETGLAENTIVFYFSDHGEMCGDHGLWGKVTLRETSVRIPLIISWPGQYPEGTRVATPVSLVDLFPTFLEMAGTVLPRDLPKRDGHSLLPFLTGNSDAFEGGVVFGEFDGEGWNHPRAWIRDGAYKLVYNHTAECRLYNLEDDPQEMNNLYENPDVHEIAMDLREALFREWDPVDVERRVLASQAERRLAPMKEICKDTGI